MENVKAVSLRMARQAATLAASQSRAAAALLAQLLQRLQALLGRIPLKPLQWIMLLYVVLGVLYLVATPPFEAADELEHVAYIQAMREGTLPVLGAGTLVMEQAAQPPGYYALASLVLSPFPRIALESQVALNPFVARNDPFSLGNKNLLLPAPLPAEVTLSVGLLRALNVALGLVTIAAAWRVGKALSPRRPAVALLSAALLAFNPMFIFISASVSNLPLAMALNGALVAAVLHVLSHTVTGRAAALIALLVAAGALVHHSMVFIAPVAIAVSLHVAWRDQRWPMGLAAVGGVVLALLAALGWWLARNQALYGDPLGWEAWLAVISGGAVPGSADALLLEWAHFRRSFWGLFGVGNLALGEFAYALLDLLVFVALFGVAYMVLQLYAIRDFAHARRELTFALVVLGVVLPFVVLYLIWSQTPQLVDGTSVFPALVAIASLLAVGFIEVIWWFLFLITPPDRSYVRAGDAVPNEALQPNSIWSARVLVLVAAITPLLVIAPAYAPLTPVAEVSAHARHVYARYGSVELVAYDTEFTRFSPGQLVPVTLYWRVIEPTPRDWTVTLALIPPYGTHLGKLSTFPGWGRLRTSAWQPGSLYADTYFLRLDPFFAGNFPLRLHVQWFDPAAQDTVEPVDAEGRAIPSVLLDLGALAFPHPPVEDVAALHTTDARLREFGGLIRAEQFTFDRATYHTSIVWSTMRPMDVSYTMFVQILNEDNEIVGQLDTPPPLPTEYWGYGERYVTEHAIVTEGALPPGYYRVITGIYDFNTLQRLPVNYNPDNPDEPRDYLTLFTFTIDEAGQLVSEALDALLPAPTPEQTPAVAGTPDAAATIEPGAAETAEATAAP